MTHEKGGARVYANTTTNIDGLLAGGNDEKKLPTAAADRCDREAVTAQQKQFAEALKLIELQRLQLKYANELLPALKAAARAHLVFTLAAARAGAIYAEFDGCGLDVPVPKHPIVSAADAVGLARAYAESGLIDPNDVILADMPAVGSTADSTADGGLSVGSWTGGVGEPEEDTQQVGGAPWREPESTTWR